MKKYVSYYRVSTKRQGVSGLGLEGQKASVVRFVAGKGTIVTEYTEIESGKKNNRTQLNKAIADANKQGATLVIAKLDRLSRNVSFVSNLMDSKVDFVCVDMPDATPLTIHIFAAIAQQERETIVARIKTALEAKRQRGESLGNIDNFSNTGRTLGRAVMQEAARTAKENIQAAAIIKDKLALPQKPTLRQIAAHLNDKGYTTRRGKPFTSVQVMRLAQSAI